MVNVSGHLLSTAEIESALIEHPSVAEAAVVSHPHEVKGESTYCFVSLCEVIYISCYRMLLNGVISPVVMTIYRKLYIQ